MTPQRVVLGETDQAAVHVTVTGPEGPVPCETIRIHSNTGTLSELEQSGTGRYTSTFAMPDDFFPRFALVAAVGTCGGADVEGHTVIPLYGTGEVELKADPFSTVRLRIAGSVFGPRQTNEWGKVRIPIVVPPGHSHGVAGNREVDLKLPPVNRVVAIAGRNRIAAGDEGRTIIWIFAIDRRGAPLVSGDISLSADKGTTTPATEVGPGVYRAFYTGPTLIGDQQSTISVSIDGDPASTDQVRFELTPGVPERIEIRTGAAGVSADRTESVPVTVAVVDRYGNPTGDWVELRTDFGALAPLVPGRRGTFDTTLSVPPFFDGRRAVRLTAQAVAAGSGRLVRDRELGLVPGPPTRVAIVGVPPLVRADGRADVLLTLRATDRHGNTAYGGEVALTATEGTIPALVQISAPETQVPFTPPLGKRSGVAEIEARIDDISASATLSLTDRTYLVAVTPRFGVVTNLGHVISPLLSVAVDQSLWFLLRGLHVLVDVGHYYSRDESREFSIESGFHAVPLYAGAGYRRYLAPKIYLSFQLCLGVHILRNKSTVRGQGSAYSHIETAARFGFKGALEGGYAIGPGKALFSAGYMYSRAAKMTFVDGHPAGLFLTGGYRLEFL